MQLYPIFRPKPLLPTEDAVPSAGNMLLIYVFSPSPEGAIKLSGGRTILEHADIRRKVLFQVLPARDNISVMN